MREQRLAGGIDAVHDGFIESIEVLVTLGRLNPFHARACPKADESERDRGHQFPFGRFLDPGSKDLRQPTVLADARGQTLLAEVANDHPQLQCAEASPELNAIV